MTQLIHTPAGRASTPSLYKLVGGIPAADRLRHPADSLVVIGRQLELIAQENRLNADVALGILRFSLFRLHQGRLMNLVPHCRSVTIYGEADVEPPVMDGVEFVPLPKGAPLSQEWFFVVDSPTFWGALLTRIVPEREGGRVRRYLFEGALTTDERTVSRASLLLNLIRQRPTAAITTRDPFANQVHWAQVAYNLMTHSEAERLRLPAALHSLPALRTILEAGVLAEPNTLTTLVLPVVVQAVHQGGAAGVVLYQPEQGQLVPAAWQGIPQPGPLAWAGSISGHALDDREPVLAALGPGDPEQAVFPQAHSVIAVPLIVNEQLWGVLTVGQAETEPTESHAGLAAMGIAAVLEVLLVGMPPAPTAPAPTAPAPSAPAPTAPAPSAPAPTAPAPTAPAPTAPTPSAPAPSAPAPAAAQPLAAPGGFGLPSWMRGGLTPTPPMAPTTRPPAGTDGLQPVDSAQQAQNGQHDYGWDVLQRQLMSALIAFDQRSAEQVWQEACSRYATEAICTELLMPVQVAVGEGWHRGEVSVAAEHFCSRFVEGKLLNLLHVGFDNPGAPLAVIGCAQSEMHEIGAIMLALFMQWSGFRVIYLGQNVPNTTIAETVRQLRPQVLGLSATTVESAHSLTEVGHILARIEPPRPQFIFGGMAFLARPDLKSRIQGQFLEGDVREIVRQLADKHRKA